MNGMLVQIKFVLEREDYSDKNHISKMNSWTTI